jgi:hypothetical protein
MSDVRYLLSCGPTFVHDLRSTVRPASSAPGGSAARVDSYLRLERLRSLRTSQRRAPPATARPGNRAQATGPGTGAIPAGEVIALARPFLMSPGATGATVNPIRATPSRRRSKLRPLTSDQNFRHHASAGQNARGNNSSSTDGRSVRSRPIISMSIRFGSSRRI